MGFATDYLNSARMSQDLANLEGSPTSEHTADRFEYTNKQLTCAVLRWRQLFENQFVDRRVVKLRPAQNLDFVNYCKDILRVLNQRDIREEKIVPQIDAFLVESARKMMTPGPDFNQRLLTLLTMGATEYHGFNAVFADSIKQHGLDPRAKFQTDQDMEDVNKILAKVGQSAGKGAEDQNLIFVTTDPSVAYRHAKMSPEWFYFFSSCGQTLNLPYLNRDYEAARKQLFQFPDHEKLTPDESQQITTFFDKWWAKLATPTSLKIAAMPMFRNPQLLKGKIYFYTKYLEKFGLEKALKHIFTKEMYNDYEHIYDQPIGPEYLQIIDIPDKNVHTERLANLENTLQQNNQSLKQQHAYISNINQPDMEQDTDRTA